MSTVHRNLLKEALNSQYLSLVQGKDLSVKDAYEQMIKENKYVLEAPVIYIFYVVFMPFLLLLLRKSFFVGTFLMRFFVVQLHEFTHAFCGVFLLYSYMHVKTYFAA